MRGITARIREARLGKETEIILYKNPTNNRIHDLLDTHNELRGIVDGGNTYYWSAFKATHCAVAEYLQIDLHPKNCLNLSR